MSHIITSQDDISRIIYEDEWMMRVLRAAEEINLPDWWIGAGFLRNKVWDYLSGNVSTPTSDVDLVYFNASNTAAESDWSYDDMTNKRYAFANWQIRNQARMHVINDFKPFTSTIDGIEHWVETATCIAVRLNNGSLEYIFCYGSDDLLGLIARPTPLFTHTSRIDTFHKRVKSKQWQQKWPNLKIMLS